MERQECAQRLERELSETRELGVRGQEECQSQKAQIEELNRAIREQGNQIGALHAQLSEKETAYQSVAGEKIDLTRNVSQLEDRVAELV